MIRAQVKGAGKKNAYRHKSTNMKLLRLAALSVFFSIPPRREGRLLPKPLRGESAAAAGLWEEGDKRRQVCAARSRKLGMDARRPSIP